MKEITYIVTGAAGHLGSHVVQKLLMQGSQVRILLLPNETCPRFIDTNRFLLKEYTGDVCDITSLKRLFDHKESRETIVIHCAGIISITKKEDPRVYDVNVAGTANIIGMCRRYAVKRLVYISSVHAIPVQPHGQTMKEIKEFDPDKVHGYYDKTKAAATRLVLDAGKTGLDTVVLHPSGIIGPFGLPTGNMSHLIKKFLSGKLPLVIHGGYDFVDVRDVADGILSAALKGKKGECYILSNRFVGFNELFDTLSQICGKKTKSRYIPMWVAKTAAPFAELYYRLAKKTPLYTRYSLGKLSENAMYSHEKANRDLSYKTRPLRNTLKDIVQYV